MRKLETEELNRLSASEYRKATKTSVIVVLDNIRSLNNIGSIFRTSDAFLIESIYLCGICAQPPHKEIRKTALGASETVDWKYSSTTEDAITKIQEKGYKTYAVEQAEKSIPLSDFNPEKGSKIALVFGNEVNGVTDEAMEMVDGCIEVPQHGTKHSLNISVCAGIVLWDVFNKIKE